MGMLDPVTAARYEQGGDLYPKLVTQYGQAAADQIAAAAAGGDATDLANALENARNVTPEKDTSTLSIFTDQITTDPLSAPVDYATGVIQKSLNALNKGIGSSFLSLLMNPWVIFGSALALFLYFGGLGWIKRKFFK